MNTSSTPKFSVIFWNIWLENQSASEQPRPELLAALDRLIDQYRPDCFGLNEVLKYHRHTEPFILRYLAERGYTHTHFATAGPISPSFDIGVAIASRHAFGSIEELELGERKAGRFEGYPRAVLATFRVGGLMLHLIVTHLAYLSRGTIPVHFEHQARLTEFVDRQSVTSRLIIGGDFNEPTLMPRSFVRRHRGLLHSKTGHFLRHTWHWRARHSTLIRANLDKVLWLNNDRLQLQKFKIIPTRVSDHKPLYARFSLHKPS